MNADKRNSLNQKFKTDIAAKLPRGQCGKLSLDAGEWRFLREVMCYRRQKKGKSKALSGGFRLRDSEA